ncbi:hypothetical protein TrRE_jg10634 [Triparma retinervis]|uniref:Uncharacterized protein n=1 Tax=Triparma retinervis TaxID=2557542 RepID=A0A9W6Z825_9STRA|nr:hypothetical protein TrRE_jg10634 [Triparma retinervis]
MAEIGFFQVIFAGAIGMTLLGKQNLPIVSHSIGQGVGRAVGFLRFLRSNADSLTRQVEGDAMRGNKELGELREEMRKGLDELESVRRELVYATNQAKPTEANWGGEVNNSLADGREKFVAVGEGREEKDSAGFLSDLIKEELIHEHYNSLDKK